MIGTNRNTPSNPSSTLGTAASKSLTKVREEESLGGASSAKKIAPPTPSGTASASPTAEVTSVPYMKGNAPNSPATGSQVLVTKKFHPNLVRASAERTQS